jgi:ribosome-binding factor A
MKTKRQKQISKLIHRELAKVLLLHSEQPLFKIVTILDVDVSPDLTTAKVFVSIFDASKVDAALKALQNAAGQLRHALARGLNLRITPRLSFINDDSIKRGQELSALIDEAVSKDAQADNEKSTT